MDFKKKVSVLFQMSDMLVSELVTLCSCLLLTQGCCYLISQESERGGEICEGLLAELQGNILSSLLGSLAALCGLAHR